jgi:hypothetical protein
MGRTLVNRAAMFRADATPVKPPCPRHAAWSDRHPGGRLRHNWACRRRVIAPAPNASAAFDSGSGSAEEGWRLTSFGAELAEWSDFYTAVATISATLVGLLFVALALRPEVMRDDGPAGLRVWSGQTFHSFLVVLVVGLIALIPDDSRTTLVITLGIVGVQGIVRVALDLRRARRDPDPHWSSLPALTRFVSPTIAYLLCLWLTQAFWRGDIDAVGWLVAVVFLLMMSAASNCWDLLKAIGGQRS